MNAHQASIIKSRTWMLSLTLMSGPTLTEADTWVFTDRSHSVFTPTATRVILLDQQQLLETELSRALPTDPHQAATIVKKRLNSTSGRRLQSDLAKAQQALADAWSMGIEKIPAVVVDRRYVVYGEPDVAKALELINRTRSQPQ